MLYGVQIWGLSVEHYSRAGSTDGWRCMERPLVHMISRMIRAKASVPHEIIRAKLAASPLVVEALTRSVSFIHSLWDLPRHRYAHLALESSRQLALQGDTTCWFGPPFSVLFRCTFSVYYTHRDQHAHSSGPDSA